MSFFKIKMTFHFFRELFIPLIGKWIVPIYVPLICSLDKLMLILTIFKINYCFANEIHVYDFTFTVLSLLAQLLMMESDCWNRVPPIPMTSAISWLTAITTWWWKKNVLNKQAGVLIKYIIKMSVWTFWQYGVHTWQV